MVAREDQIKIDECDYIIGKETTTTEFTLRSIYKYLINLNAIMKMLQNNK